MRELKGLPLFLALVPSVWCLSYAFSVLMVGSIVGRQSSTSGIAPFLALIAIPPLALAGITAGRIARHVLSPTFRKKWTPMKWCAPVVLAIVAVAAFRQASGPILAGERAAHPRVIVNAAQLHKREGSMPQEGVLRATRVYDHLGKVNPAIPWTGGNVHLTNAGDVLQVSFEPGSRAVFIPLDGIDYIIFIDAVALRDPQGRPTLALLITGRATGRRDLLAVLSESGELVYLELLERFWNFRPVALAVASSSAEDLIVIGSEPQRALLFGP